jgi:hypothetical protein
LLPSPGAIPRIATPFFAALLPQRTSGFPGFFLSAQFQIELPLRGKAIMLRAQLGPTRWVPA